MAVAEHSLELDPLAWVLGGHALEVVDEGSFSVADVGVVLAVVLSGESFDGLGGPVLLNTRSSKSTTFCLLRSMVSASTFSPVRRFRVLVGGAGGYSPRSVR